MALRSFASLRLNGLAPAALLFVMASGLTLAFGLMRVVNLAHGAFFVLGGYVEVAVLDRTGSFFAALAAGAFAGMIAGIVMERFLLARVRGLELSEALITIAIGMVIADALLAVFGGHPKSLRCRTHYVARSSSASSSIRASARHPYPIVRRTSATGVPFAWTMRAFASRCPPAPPAQPRGRDLVARDKAA